MKLVASEERFIVECHTDDFGYKSNDCYVFGSKEELENFLGINDDCENHIYKRGTDISGRDWKIGCNEFPDCVYSKTEYEIDWEVNSEED